MSTEMPLTPLLELLPAASTAVPVADWSAPSPIVFGAGQASMPERMSWHVNETVTEWSYQPSDVGVPSAAAEIVGCVSSRLTLAGSVAVLPALSRAVPVTA